MPLIISTGLWSYTKRWKTLMGRTTVTTRSAGPVKTQGRHPEAIVSAQRSLDVFLATGNRFGQVRAMNLLGRNHGMSGRYEQALTYCQHALHLFTDIEDPFGQAQSLDSLGFAHHHLGDHARAIAEYEQAIAL
jgi:tetratricopeptide (TPR) repeat protein